MGTPAIKGLSMSRGRNRKSLGNASTKPGNFAGAKATLPKPKGRNDIYRKAYTRKGS